MPNLINYNGRFLDKDESIVNSTNRSFQYGDGLFETIRLSNGKVMFLKDHFERLQRGTQYFKLQLPEYFSEDFLKQQILDTAESNDISLNGRIKLTIFRNGEGKYEPLTNEANWLITASPLYRPDYQWNEEGLHLGIFDKAKKPCDEISNYKTTSSLLYVLAAVYKKESGFDESIILNTKGNIADTIYANLFLIKNEKIYTPALSEAPVDGVMRKQVLQLAKKQGYKIYEEAITGNDLTNADEIFLTNAIKGILWVRQFENQPYDHEIAKQLLNNLNELIE
jgi:branched-chain amino acid aminotransferase